MAREQLVSSSHFTCDFCHYTSPKRYNYIRHLMCKHNVCNSLKYTNNLPNNTIDLPNNTMDLPNNTIDLQNHTLEHNQKEIPFKCQACYKILTTKYTLQRHLTKCKGIKHPFECQYCHKTYKQQQHKSRHETKCLLLHQAKMQQAEHIGTQIINNTTNNNINNINNTTINNNLTINLVAFPKEKNRLVPFLSDHLDAKAIAAIFGNPAYLMDGFKEYSKAMIKRPENNIVIKQNLRDLRSKVHVGDNNWEMISDKDILPIITDSITSEAAHQLEFSGAQELLNKARYKACEKLFNSILSPDSEDYKENFKNASEKIKYVILNESYKDKLNENPNK